MNTFSTVMPNPKGSLVNVIPTKDNVDYDGIYHYTSSQMLDNFKFFKTNRDTYEKNVAKIEKQIRDKVYGAQYVPPIVIDINTMCIIDGQNRWEAYKKAMMDGVDTDLRVIYVDVPSDYIDNLIKVLQESKKWNNTDYFHRAIANGNSACQKIEDWCEKHGELCMDNKGLNRSYAMAFIYGKRVDREVKDLSLTINKTQLDFAEKVYKEVLMMFKAMKYKRANFIEGMAQSWFNIRKDKNSLVNMAIEDMGMEFLCNNIYQELHAYQPTSKRADWDFKFGQIVQNVYRKYRDAA